MLRISEVRCEYMKNPIGIDIKRPRISWQLESDSRGVVQTTYQIQVAEDESFEQLVMDSGQVGSDQSIHVEITEIKAVPRKRYFYRVQVWDQFGESSGWSGVNYWETGMLDNSKWQAEWISTPSPIGLLEQSPLLRRGFSIDGPIKSARVYATALGLYELELNGKRVGDAYFTPGWTSYQKRLQYQTYDVTELLTEGDNAVAATLGNGWYKGYLGWEDQKEVYGDQLALLLQMHITLEDGREIIIATDDKWKCAPSPILMSEIYHGETYDARLEKPNWSSPKLNDKNCRTVVVLEHTKDILVAQENVPVRKMEELKPVELIITPKGEVVLDMGQNMVGWVRFSVKGEAGQEVQIRHAEVLDKDGNFYVDNIRSAKQTIRYILKGGEKETYEPHFTFQGFRYIQLVGFNSDSINLDDFTGVVLHSDMETTGEFKTSDPLINQLQHNILWGLKGNFLDVPTDCPQRDERLGWTGDAQMFIRTATYLTNVAPFFTKWLRDLKADQATNGGVPFVVPNVLGQSDSTQPPFSSAAWGDAAVINPWTLYLVYGDKRLLEEQYESMKAWVEYIRSQGENEFLWNTGFHFGDWLALDSKPDSYIGATDRDFIATSFYAHSTSLLTKTATILGEKEDVVQYSELHKNILKELRNEFVTPAGRLSVPTQTGQILALMFDLVEGEAKERAVNKLMQLLEESNNHLATGFVGTPYLNHVLTESGNNEVAYKLLFQKDYPSWLYQVTKGATTIWEHWDGIKEDGSFWSKDMNSFNHYAYGAIGDWLYRKVAGIDTDEASPAYKKVRIQPHPGEGLDWVEGNLQTMYGPVRSYWKKAEGQMEVQVTIPPNTEAEVLLPNANLEQLTESGANVGKVEGIKSAETTAEGVLVSIGSGNFVFKY